MIIKKISFKNEFVFKVCISSKPLFFALFELSFIVILFCSQVPVSLDQIFIKLSKIVFKLVPIINTIPFFQPIDELPLVKRNSTINLSGFSMGKIIDPVALIEKFRGWQLSIAVSHIILYVSSEKNILIFYENSLFALSDTFLKAAFVKGSIIVYQSSESMRKTIFPLAFIIRRIFVKIMQG